MDQEDPFLNSYGGSVSADPNPLNMRPPTSKPSLNSVLNFSRSLLNISSRPFLTNNTFTLNSAFNLSMEIFDPTAQPSEPMTMETTPKLPEVRCQYCNENFASNVITEHSDNCDMRKLFCEKCGEKVLIDIYDLHYEECSAQDESESHSEMHQEVPNYHRHTHQDEVDNDEEDETSMESEEPRPFTIRRMFFIPESEMTYERLLMLDAQAVKKGMTPEQLKNFPVKLYVKSLDGEGSCNICMSEYETGEYIRKLSCNHENHEKCIDQWLSENFTCPTCKTHLR